MRFRDILLEYDRSISLDRFATPLWDACTKREDHGCVFSNSIEKHMETMDGPDYGKWDDAKRAVLHKKVITDVLTMIEASDPTPNKEYVQWMCLRYIQDGIHLLEDMPRTGQYLAAFHQLKKGGYFRRVPADAKWADINQFRRLSDLGDFVMARQQAAVSNSDLDRQLRANAIAESEMLHDGPDYMVVCPESMEASQYWGRNTQWCTAAKEDNRYHQYNDAPLYIIIDKKNNRRWQLYFEGYRPAFMDERDEPIVWEDFPPQVWLAFDWPREVFPTVVLSAKASKDPELCQAVLSTLDNSQLMTAYFWFKPEDRKVFAPILKERLARVRSKVIGERNWKIDVYALPEALIKLAATKPMAYLLSEMDAKFNHPDNAFVSDLWVRPAENFEIILHSSRAILADIGGKSWTCWRDATSYHNRVVWCYCGPDEMRISKGYMNDGPQDVGNVYNINESKVLPDQDAWHAVIDWIRPVAGESL